MQSIYLYLDEIIYIQKEINIDKTYRNERIQETA